MASEKPLMILRSVSDISLVEIQEMTDVEAWRLIYTIRPAKKRKRDVRLQVCFTGFGKEARETQENMASLANMNVVKSVTKVLNFLVIGNNAGPKKIELALQQDVSILTEEQFENLVETGVLPSEEVVCED
jgi:NAD-dependent DNA ligase